MEIKRYFLTAACPELAPAIAEIMAMFKIAPGSIEPESIEPESIEPENIEPENIEPESIEPENIEPENIEPESIEPGNIEPGTKETARFLSEGGVLVENTVYYDAAKVKVRTKIRVCALSAQLLQKENQALLAANENRLILAKRLTKLNVFNLLRQITGVNPSPWGILRGVRPGKIAGKLLAQGLTKPEIIKNITENYGVEQKRAQLLSDIAFRQHALFREFAGKEREKMVSVYIGVPYCQSKCLYCSFSSALLPKSREDTDIFFAALQTDMEWARRLVEVNCLKVQSIYIGGGTPTSLDGRTFGRLLELAVRNFRGQDTVEFTVEAGRPDSVDDEKIEHMRRFGVTRTSINPQSMREETLALIGRRHTVEDIINAFYKIRLAKIPIVNMDVIAGLPGETEKDMDKTMAHLAGLGPENITVHTLAVKRGSLLRGFLCRAQPGENWGLPNETVVRNMLEIAAEYAVELGMAPYYLYRQKYTAGNLENTGYAKDRTECLYNMQIIAERQTIIGIGPAAGTKALWPDGHLKSCYNPKDVRTYVEKLPTYLRARESLLTKLYRMEK